MSEVLPAIEIETGPAPGASVIWLHGLGADGSDFEPIVAELGLPASPAIRFVFPHAPMRPVTINGGWVMRAWYDVRMEDFKRLEDEAGVRASQVLVEALIARERSRGVPASRIVLAGFSQGGAITLQTGLRRAEPLAGMMALSSYLPLADSVQAEAHPSSRGVPIFMAHGTDDPVIPFALGEGSRRRLEELGYAVQWHRYPMGHSVCMEEVADIREWLAEVLL